MLVGEGGEECDYPEKWKLGHSEVKLDWGWRGENNPFVALALSSTKSSEIQE